MLVVHGSEMGALKSWLVQLLYDLTKLFLVSTISELVVNSSSVCWLLLPHKP